MDQAAADIGGRLGRIAADHQIEAAVGEDKHLIRVIGVQAEAAKLDAAAEQGGGGMASFHIGRQQLL
ncbi:hypothetical protein D3C87_1873610 [compost metagenome]